MEIILAPLFELLMVIVGAIFQLVLYLLGSILSLAWLAAHERGLKRLGYVIAGFAGLYLLAGITSPLWASPAVVLGSAFSWPIMLGVFILMMLAAALPGALSARSEPEADAPQASRRPAPRIDPHDISGYVLASFAGLMIFGLAVTYQTERQRQTLADKLCAAADNRISETWKARGDKALSFTEAILKRDLHGKIPCLEGPAE